MAEPNKVYQSIQPVTEPTPRTEGVEVYIPVRQIYDGSFSKTEGDSVVLTNRKLASYRMVIGTDRSLYGLLKKNTDIFPNGPYFLDSRDNGVEIHNHKFNQSPKYVYSYMGGNYELISCTITTSKKNTLVQAEQSSTIDPSTKKITTTVSQSCTDSDKDLLDKSTINNDIWSRLNNTNYKEDRKTQLIKSAKDEKSTIEDLKSTYQVTREDIEKFVGNLKSQFKNMYDNAKTTGDISPLLKSNTLKTTVKVKRYVRTTVNPSDYSQLSNPNPNTSTSMRGYSQSDVSNQSGNWNSGMKYLKNSNSVIFLGYHNQNKISKDRTIGVNSFPYADVIMEKELELELDGARVLSSPLTQTLKGSMSLNNISDRVQSQYKGNIKVIGRPGLVSSLVIYLNNISKRYTGEWYTKKVRHSIDQSGYFCTAELIRKEVPVVLSQVTTSFDSRDIYKEFYKVASNRVKYGRDVEADVKNAFLEYIKNNPDQKDKNLVVDMSQYDPKTGSVPIYPASNDVVDLDAEREKHRK